ncbi:MAG: hypothetical protein QOJ16_2143 [Acidobacteriota bacterium]|nr:hypothetical protein [Acidobacteriota bacterium]
MVPRSSRVRLDLNSSQFQDDFFTLETAELKQVVASLRRLRQMDWAAVYSHSGLNWEAVDHIKTPNGAKACSIRLSRKIRAIGYRDGDFLRLVSLHPDHDSAYE